MLFAAAAPAPTSNITTALIALAGALVGGLLAAGTQLIVERLRYRREHASAQARILGIKRVLDYCLSLWEALLDQAHEQGRWWHADLEPERGWTDEDLQQIAAGLDEEHWNQIRVALVVVHAASTMRRTAGHDRDLEFDRTVEGANSGKSYERMKLALETARSALRR